MKNPIRYLVLGMAALVAASCFSHAANAQTAEILGRFNTAPATITSGERVTVQTNNRGILLTNVTNAGGTTAADTQSGADGISNANAGLAVFSRGMLFNGTSFDRLVAINTGGTSTGLGVQAVALQPNTATTAAATFYVSPSVESGKIVKATGGNLYRVSVTAGASAGFLMVFNSTTVPADGAVTPIMCRPVAANANIDVDRSVLPLRGSSGISVAFSTTGCFTKTASATATFEVDYM